MATQKPLLNCFLTTLRDRSVLTDDLFPIFLRIYTQSLQLIQLFQVPYLRILPGTMPPTTTLIPYLRFKTLKNNTLLHSTYQSSPYTYMGVPPLGIIYVVYPMVWKKSPRVLPYVSYKDMCCPKWLLCINVVHFGLE